MAHMMRCNRKKGIFFERRRTMPLRSKPIYIMRPDETYYCGPGFVPYYYQEELKEKGINNG